MLYLANSLNIVADMTIALSQMWFFYRSRTGVKRLELVNMTDFGPNSPFLRSDSIINLLILYSINTGLLTGAFSILELIIVWVHFLREYRQLIGLLTPVFAKARYTHIPRHILCLFKM